MRILVACEESQNVTKAFRERGHEAFSCDLKPCSGGHPEWHMQCDVLEILNDQWDVVLAFPPCTHLAISGAAHFEKKRADGRQQQGIEFFKKFTRIKCERVAIENPIGIMSTEYRKPNQVIHPWQFGHPEQKSTCLWLKNLPRLIPTKYVHAEMMELPVHERQRLYYLWNKPDRAKLRSITFPGIADAMAQQCGDLSQWPIITQGTLFDLEADQCEIFQ